MKRTLSNKSETYWRDKLNPPNLPKVVEIPEKWARAIGHGKMVILTPSLIMQFMERIPDGQLVTINQIRHKFAFDFNVDTACPMTTGLFTVIAAQAAEEERQQGKKRIPPYWRVLKQGGKLNPKYPGGVKSQARHLESEGFSVIKAGSGANWKVKDYEPSLISIFQPEAELV